MTAIVYWCISCICVCVTAKIENAKMANCVGHTVLCINVRIYVHTYKYMYACMYVFGRCYCCFSCSRTSCSVVAVAAPVAVAVVPCLVRPFSNL